jgi:predicted nucleic acid-binding protein
MAALVLDASVVLAVPLQETNRRVAASILARVVDDGAAVPGIWHLEVGNILLLAELRRTISAADRVTALRDLSQLPVEVDQETASRAWRDMIELAERHRLTLYDAAYLELSLRRRLPLATFDAALRRAADAAGVQPLDHSS